ncbi:MAG TPA: sugar phosphate isomerase/epimerase [Planctomycetota bacterium]|nr:sugar phosphate isomerase/epimerase [Planctomycetota bacterium]
MAIPISIQLYTVRDAIAKEGARPVLKAIADIGFPYIEGGSLYGMSNREFKQLIDGLGLKQMGAHCGYLDKKNWAQIEDDARTIGYKHLITSVGKDEFTSPDKIRAAAEKVNAAVNHFAPKGFVVSIHNHWWEFDGPNKGDLLLELCPGAHLQLDIYWAKTGGANPAEVIGRYARRTKLLHIKDGPADGKNPQQPMTAAGAGTVDIASSVRAAEQAGVEYLSIELDSCATDMMTAVRESYDYLTRRGLAKGNR